MTATKEKVQMNWQGKSYRGIKLTENENENVKAGIKLKSKGGYKIKN